MKREDLQDGEGKGAGRRKLTGREEPAGCHVATRARRYVWGPARWEHGAEGGVRASDVVVLLPGRDPGI